MFVDIVVPNKNEQKMLDMAHRLGIEGLIFLYQKKELKAGEKIIADLKLPADFIVTTGLIHRGKECSRSRKHALSITVAIEPEKSPPLFERGGADAVFGLEVERRKDSLHFRSSGLNQVLAVHARENELMVGISMGDLLRTKGLTRARLLGRHTQNIRVCRKFQAPMSIASLAENEWELRSLTEMRSLLLSLGAQGNQANEILLANWTKMKRVLDAKKGILRTRDITVEPIIQS